MSYDIRLTDKETGETLEADEIHDVNGGTMAIGGTSELWLNVTYNYGRIYYRLMGERGIRAIYGLTGAESVPILEAAIAQLADDVHADYWAATEGNAKAALAGLLKFAQMKPEGVWNGD